MRDTVIYAPGDIRLEERPDPSIVRAPPCRGRSRDSCVATSVSISAISAGSTGR